MPFQVICPQCLTTSLVAEEHAGAKGRCKSCRGKIRVPLRETTACAHCGIGLSDVPVVTDEEGKSFCKICWLDEIEPQRTANEAAAIIGCALCGDLFPTDQVKQVDNLFVCSPCEQNVEQRVTKTMTTPVGEPAPAPQLPAQESNSLAARSPVLKLARGLLRSVRVTQ